MRCYQGKTRGNPVKEYVLPLKEMLATLQKEQKLNRLKKIKKVTSTQKNNSKSDLSKTNVPRDRKTQK